MSRIESFGAFLSYSHLDNDYEDGKIIWFRDRLSGAVRLHSGERFDIFLDREKIEWGQNWKRRIHEALNTSSFLIPILTPGWFKSQYCRKEFEVFMERERKLGRDDLIFPVYYVSCKALENRRDTAVDEVAVALSCYQYIDWRELRNEDRYSMKVAKTFDSLAIQILSAMERNAPVETPVPEGSAQTGASTPPPTSSPSPVPPTAKQPVIPDILIIADHQASETKGAKATPPHDANRHAPVTHYVEKWGRKGFTTITEAIRSARPGDRIVISPEIYREALVVDKRLEIIGDEGGEVILEARNGNAITFKATSGTISNLIIRQLEGDWCGVDISQGELVLENCTISSQEWVGVCIRDKAHPTLHQNKIQGSGQYGVMFCHKGKGILKRNEIVSNNIAGVLITSGATPIITENRITQNGTGIEITNLGGGTINNNNLTGNEKGALRIAEDCEVWVEEYKNIT